MVVDSGLVAEIVDFELAVDFGKAVAWVVDFELAVGEQIVDFGLVAAALQTVDFELAAVVIVQVDPADFEPVVGIQQAVLVHQEKPVVQIEQPAVAGLDMMPVLGEQDCLLQLLGHLTFDLQALDLQVAGHRQVDLQVLDLQTEVEVDPQLLNYWSEPERAAVDFVLFWPHPQVGAKNKR